jgi:hypothetical protein
MKSSIFFYAIGLGNSSVGSLATELRLIVPSQSALPCLTDFTCRHFSRVFSRNQRRISRPERRLFHLGRGQTPNPTPRMAHTLKRRRRMVQIQTPAPAYPHTHQRIPQLTPNINQVSPSEASSVKMCVRLSVCDGSISSGHTASGSSPPVPGIGGQPLP